MSNSFCDFFKKPSEVALGFTGIMWCTGGLLEIGALIATQLVAPGSALPLILAGSGAVPVSLATITSVCLACKAVANDHWPDVAPKTERSGLLSDADDTASISRTSSSAFLNSV